MRRGGIKIVLTTAAVGLLAGALAAGGLLARPRPAVPEPVAAVAAPPATQRPAPGASAPTATLSAASAPAPARTAHAPGRDTGCVIVSLKRALSDEERRALGLASASSLRGSRLLVTQAPTGMSASDYSAKLRSSGVVIFAEPDRLLEPAGAPAYSPSPNDPDFRSEVAWSFTDFEGATTSINHAKSWALRGDGSANFDQVWPALASAKAGAEGTPAVRVAVIDTGFYFDQFPDPSPNIFGAIDECSSYSPTKPLASRVATDGDVTPVSLDSAGGVVAQAAHGTMVASEIGQGANNGVGSNGAAWDTRVDIYKVQGVATADFGGVHKGEAIIPESAIVRAIYDAVDDAHRKGYRLVINMSLVEVSGDGGSSAIRDAINYARRPDHDVVVVAAAGNEGADGADYPAAYPGVIAVGSLGRNGTRVYRSSFSNYGSALDILAPGEDIWGPTKPGTIKSLPGSYGVAGYDWWNGTSMAAPYVSAAAALLLRTEPSLTATEVETYLTRNAVDMGAPGRDDAYGWGSLDVYAAYRALVTPITTADTKVAYAEGETVKLTVSDRDSGPNVGTFFKIDGSGPPEARGKPFTGLTVTIPADSTGGAHRLEYWSQDSNGLTEAVHSDAYVVLATDTLPPVSSSDATSTYGGQATLTLSATDPSPGWGDQHIVTLLWLTRTFYRLDAGQTTTGTGLTTGATGSHTLLFWSTDYAGNVEPTNTATFTVTPLTTRASIARNTSSVRHGSHVHLSGTLTPARAGDTVTVWIRLPGSSKYTKSYKRTLTSVNSSGKGTWQSLTYTLTRKGRYYFRVVFAGDSRYLSRKAYTSGSVYVNVR